MERLFDAGDPCKVYIRISGRLLRMHAWSRAQQKPKLPEKRTLSSAFSSVLINCKTPPPSELCLRSVLITVPNNSLLTARSPPCPPPCVLCPNTLPASCPALRVPIRPIRPTPSRVSALPYSLSLLTRSAVLLELRGPRPYIDLVASLPRLLTRFVCFSGGFWQIKTRC
eukprot:5149687-Pyramimonas_sp.AAC.1